ncbi:MAG: type II secretion system F family protein [Chloroflexi bacterium]|nr:type II secretion system F family protein [Chloroflexota bacterium]
MVILAVLVLFATVFVAVLAFSGGTQTLRVRLESIRGQTVAPVDEPADEYLPFTQRVLMPMVRVPVNQMARLMPKAVLDGVQQRLVIAGEPMELQAFLTMQFVSIVMFTLLPLLLILGTGSVSITRIGIIAGFALVGYMLPQMWLKQRVTARQTQIIKSLPDAFDLITTCVEAGLGLDAALARVAEKVEGPFADELTRTLRDISLGGQRRDALKELGERTGVPDLVTFVNAVIQAELMGSSVGTVLRVQSDQLRVRRRQRAEEQAYKAPVKMIFPLILCIFPTLFIVILGPAVITIMNDFPGG